MLTAIIVALALLWAGGLVLVAALCAAAKRGDRAPRTTQLSRELVALEGRQLELLGRGLSADWG